MEKTVVTLGEMLAADARRQLRRYQPAGAQSSLLRLLAERNQERAAGASRFNRREAVPGPSASPFAPVVLPAVTAAGTAGARPAAGTAPGPAEGGAPRAVSGPASAAPRWPGAARPEPSGTGAPVPAGLRDQLRPALGPAVDLARVHDDARADQFARSLGADAVTVGRDVYFRSGSLPGQSPAGLGLLAHEVSHVADGERPGAAQARARPGGAMEEEERARAAELRHTWPAVSPLAGQAHVTPVPAAAPAPAAPGPAAAGPPVPARAATPMLAATDRPAAVAAGPDLDRLRQRLFRDLMAQIRVEFERGS